MKKLTTLLLTCLLCFATALCFTACGGGDDKGGNGGEHVHNYQVTDYFDRDQAFAKTLTCANDGCDQKTINKATIEISTADELVALSEHFANGSSIKSTKPVITIKNDIDMTGKSWTPIDISYVTASYTFEGAGEGVTIRNLSVSGENAGFFGLVASELTVKKINIKDSSFEGEVYAGALMAQASSAKNINVANCTIEDCTVNGAEAAGAFYGYGGLDDAVTVNYGFDNIAVTGCTITSAGYAGGVFGIGADADYNEGSTVKVSVSTSCIVTDTTVTSTASDDKSAGQFVGLLGCGDVHFMAANAIKFVGGSVTSNGVNVPREYGRAGWTSQENSGKAGFNNELSYKTDGSVVL